MKAVIRVDSSKKIGSGHVMRCLTLAESLSKKSVKVYFICRDHQDNLIDHISDNGYSVYTLDSENSISNSTLLGVTQEQDVNDCKNILKKIKPEWLIVDHYSIDAFWHSKLKNNYTKILVIDDLANRKLDCEVLLDQNFYLNPKERYSNLISNDCTQLVGPNFSLLRNEFLSTSRKNLYKQSSKLNIFIFMGGADYHNQTKKVINAVIQLIREGESVSADVLVGPINSHAHEIESICKKYSDISFYFDTNNISKLMSQADISIGAGGSVSLERCYLGLPSLVILVAKNQIETTIALDSIGAVINLGWYEDVEEAKVVFTLRRFISSNELLTSMKQKAFSIFDFESDKFGSQHVAELMIANY